MKELKLRKCKECGEYFRPTTARNMYCKKTHYRPCPICGKDVKVIQFSDPPRCCSDDCKVKLMKRTNLDRYGTEDAGNSKSASEKRKQTCMDRYGVDNPAKVKSFMDKHKKTIQSRYGVENISQLDSNKQKVSATWKDKSQEEISDIVNKREATCREKYGVDNPRQSQEIIDKTKQTLLDNYGVDCSLLIPEVREKVKTTMLDRYGVLNPGQSKEIRDKASKTCIEKYGVPKYSMTEEFKVKFKETVKARYGVDNPMQVEEFQNKAKDTNVERYGLPAAFMSDESKDKARQSYIKNDHSKISKPNKLFSELLTSAGIDNRFEFNLENRWYDIEIIDRNILVEIDPTYTHSTQHNIWSNGLDKNYHRDKSRLAEKHEYRCIHVFDWDDTNKIVGLIQKPSIKYNGRDVECRFITEEQCNLFLDMYHIQGSVRNQEVCIGLILDEELLSVMSFGRPRYNKNVQWELYRYASQFDVTVTGGASKLFKKFVDELHPKSIVSYCDKSKFDGNLYQTLGFKYEHTSSPTKIWSKGKRYITNNLLLSRGYDQLFGTDYGKGTDNEQLMIDNGWRSVYDCGQATFIWKHESL